MSYYVGKLVIDGHIDTHIDTDTHTQVTTRRPKLASGKNEDGYASLNTVIWW